MIEHYRPKLFAGAIIFAGLAASVKYGGVFMIPAIWTVCLYNAARECSSTLIEYVRSKHRIILSISWGIIFSIISIFAIASFLLFKHQELLYRTKIKGLYDFLHIRNVRILIVFMVIVFVIGVIWLGVNKSCKMFSRSKILSKKYRYLAIVNKSFLFLFYIISSIFFIFTILNPTYWLFPVATGKSVVGQFMMTTMGTNIDVGINTPIFDLNRLIWFKMLFDKRLLGIWIGILFCCYLAYEVISLKKNWIQNQKFVFQRFLLWIYMVSLLSVLVVLVSHRPHHYLLPVVLVVGVLTSFSIVQIVMQTKIKKNRVFLCIFFATFLSLAMYTRGGKIVNRRNLLLDRKKNDTGVMIGEWLSESFSADKKIWKDYNTFYIPPEFSKVFYPKMNRYIDVAQINSIKPDILVFTSPRSVAEFEELSKQGRLSEYRQRKHIKYSNKLDDFTDIYILVKAQE